MRSLLDKARDASTHPVDVGQRTEAIVLAELIKRGHRVLLPFGVNHRYDFVLDLGNGFLRAQCKTGRLRRGVINFSTQSVQTNTRGCSARGYQGDAELFLVYCPGNNRVYAVPVDESPVGYMNLRVDPPRNGQAVGVRWARQYELPG